MERKQHWENIYQTKTINEVSWYQPTPYISLDLISEAGVLKNAQIIDIGGGDSFLVDNLISNGYENIHVLDISSAAIKRAKDRLGKSANSINWIESDVVDFKTEIMFDCWHDRAAFHFLTEEKEINRYVNTARNNIKPGGILIIGTFSKDGPEKCSGIVIRQYSEELLMKTFEPYFKKIKCINVNHKTPFDTIQNFVFCIFKRE